MNNLIIIGIDPGTTLAYAALDIKGNIVELFSKKETSLGSLIDKVIKVGKPLITCCDVASPPSFVTKFAIKTGSKIISPESDLLVKEKKDLTRKHNTKNVHQMDALSAALFGYKIISPMLDKIDSVLKDLGKENLKKEVLELVIKHDISIKNAISMIEQPKKEENKIIKKVAEKKILLESDYMLLFRKLKQAQKDISLLRNQNNRLISEKKDLEKKNSFLIKKISSVVPKNKTKELLYFKDKTINNLALEKDEKNLEIKILNHKLLNLNKLLIDMNNKTLLKKINKLSISEFDRLKKIFNLKKGDILLVDDLTSYSKKAVEKIKNKVSVIIYNKSNKGVRDKLPFTCINSKSLKIQDDDYVALVTNESLESELGKQDIISKVIREYQKERKQ